MNIEFSVGIGKGGDKSVAGDPPNILVIGDFSGPVQDADSSTAIPAIRNMFKIDVAEIESALARLGPTLTIDAGDERLALRFTSFDDFHPDTLYRNISAFSLIAELKQSLRDPATAEAAASVCRQMLGVDAGRPASADLAAAAPGTAEPDEDMFSRLLGRSAGSAGTGNATVRTAVEAILRDVGGGPEFKATAPTDALELLPALDAWSSSAMRDILRHPDFRRLESNWRALGWLAENLDADPEPALWLVDVAAAAEDGWTRELPERITQTVGSCSLVIVLHEYTDSVESLGQLRAAAETTRRLDAKLFAAASPSLAGRRDTATNKFLLDGSDFDDEVPAAWAELRSLASASGIGLGFPRILLRQPYGKRSDPVDAFVFEELEPGPAHESFFWGNPAVVLAVMAVTGWPSVELPMVVYDDGGGQAIKPAAEYYLAESACDKLLERGIAPVVAVRGQSDVRVPRLQSIAIEQVRL